MGDQQAPQIQILSNIVQPPRHWRIDNVPAFCITLERRADRWRRFQDQSGLDNLEVKRFLGVDGKTIDVTNDDRISTLTKRNIAIKSRRSHEELDSVGGVGCALSHIAAWQWMVDNKQEVCLIFEDDAVVPSDFVERANECIASSPILKDPKKWDIWMLGGKWEDLTRIPNEPKAVRIGAFVLFHAYVMTLHGAKRLLKDVYPIHAHIDIWVSIFAHLHDLRVVGCTDLILQQNNKVKTDIQSEKGCDICNVPVNYGTTHTLISKTDLNIARVSQAALIALLGYVLWQKFMANRS
jgi:GR25 family glycosyltransferase involved in LPS biosynthesis